MVLSGSFRKCVSTKNNESDKGILQVFFQAGPAASGCFKASIACTLEGQMGNAEQSSKGISKESQGRFVVKIAVTSLSIQLRGHRSLR